jgi:hypothetical protein
MAERPDPTLGRRPVKARELVPIVIASAAAGALGYYAIDRITFLTGHTVRDIRHAARAAA